jgi:hypothetical protein
VLGWGGTTIPKNFIFREPWLSSTARRLRSGAAPHKAPGFAGVSALRPVTNSFYDWVYSFNTFNSIAQIALFAFVFRAISTTKGRVSVWEYFIGGLDF